WPPTLQNVPTPALYAQMFRYAHLRAHSNDHSTNQKGMPSLAKLWRRQRSSLYCLAPAGALETATWRDPRLAFERSCVSRGRLHSGAERSPSWSSRFVTSELQPRNAVALPDNTRSRLDAQGRFNQDDELGQLAAGKILYAGARHADVFYRHR